MIAEETPDRKHDRPDADALDALPLERPWTAERARAWWETHLPPSGPKPAPGPESYAPTERVENRHGP